jgi:hypothetical protein
VSCGIVAARGEEADTSIVRAGYHATQRTTRSTLLFQSLRGSDPFRIEGCEFNERTSRRMGVGDGPDILSPFARVRLRLLCSSLSASYGSKIPQARPARRRAARLFHRALRGRTAAQRTVHLPNIESAWRHCRLLEISVSATDLRSLGAALEALPADHPISDLLRGHRVGRRTF